MNSETANILSAVSLPELLFKAADTWPDRTYLQTRNGYVISTLTFATVAREVREIAAGLKDSGLRANDKIGLLAENRPEWITCYFAILTAGGIVVPLDSLMSAVELGNILIHSKTQTVICSQKFADFLHQSGQTARAGVKLINLDKQGELPRRQGEGEVVQLSSDQTAVIIFTSGTTGHSKGVMLSHRNLISNVISSLTGCQMTSNDNFHLLLPLHHTFSSTVNMLVPVACGARATFATSYKSRDIVDDIRIAGITVLVGVPQVYENIMLGIERAISQSSPPKRSIVSLLQFVSNATSRIGIQSGSFLFRFLREKAGMNSIRLMISGGAALPIRINRFFDRLGFTLMQGYGLTETSPVLTVNRPHRNRIGSVGTPIPNVEIRIDNPGHHGIGEICARGENIMQGYFENESATREVLRDGWFHTGDAGYVDKNGFLYITGRLKNVIVTSAGKNIYPEEIESRLNLSPIISESMVLGLEKKKGAGEELFAVMLPDSEFIETETAAGRTVDLKTEIAAVISDYNSSVPTYRRIREWTIRMEPFEKTSTRKIKRYLYKDKYNFSS